MIISEGGKNIYPEDIESNFDGLAVKEYCVFAVNYVWKQQTLLNEQLMIVLHPDPALGLTPAVIQDLQARNRRLAELKRISSYVIWEVDFPRTASMKIKRGVLADQIANGLSRDQGLQIL
jgi:long-chain acyl-CoA synthetase